MSQMDRMFSNPFPSFFLSDLLIGIAGGVALKFIVYYKAKNAKKFRQGVDDPQWRDFWREAYAAVIPGYHQNKEHWNTVILDGSIPDEEIRRMIAESYDLICGKK